MNPPCVAIVGASGAVGAEMLAVLEQRRFPVGELRLLASARSAGRTLRFAGAEHAVAELCEDSFAGVDFALFSAGGLKHWAPRRLTPAIFFARVAALMLAYTGARGHWGRGRSNDDEHHLPACPERRYGEDYALSPSRSTGP